MTGTKKTVIGILMSLIATLLVISAVGHFIDTSGSSAVQTDEEPLESLFPAIPYGSSLNHAVSVLERMPSDSKVELEHLVFNGYLDVIIFSDKYRYSNYAFIAFIYNDKVVGTGFAMAARVIQGDGPAFTKYNRAFLEQLDSTFGDKVHVERTKYGSIRTYVHDHYSGRMLSAIIEDYGVMSAATSKRMYEDDIHNAMADISRAIILTY